jgi:hypothetical protein
VRLLNRALAGSGSHRRPARACREAGADDMHRACDLRALIAAVLMLASAAAMAGEADVIAVEVRASGPHVFRFDVTVRSRDTGWDDYAERFEVVAPDGSVLGTRVLLHPHETEQPFTRELDGVRIAPSIGQVTVRAWMKRGKQVKAAGGATMQVKVPH